MFQRSLLTDKDVEPLAEGVYAVLKKVGVLCQNEEILKALDAAGANVDYDQQYVRFPKKMQREFVEQLRKEHPQQDDSGHRDFKAPTPPTLGTQVAQFFYDYEQKEKRSANGKDFVQLIKFGDVLHPDAGVGHCLARTDVPALLEPLESGMLLAEYAHKPHPPFAANVKQVDYLIEMGEILGINDWFTWGAICFAHPLRFDKDVADKFVRRVQSGVTTGLSAMPVAGVTTPATLPGFITVASAEHLATWLTARAVNPQVLLRGSIWGGTMDMRTGEVSYCSFDGLLYAFAAVEFIRRWCGMNVAVGGGEYCDAKAPGLYALLEKAHKAMTIAAFTGRHPRIGSGMLEEGKTLSPAQLLLERDLTTGVQNYGRTVQATPEAIALETIMDVGVAINTNYLEAEHTLRHFRQCLWLPEFIDRSGWQGFDHEETILKRVQEKVNELTAAYRKPDVDPDKLAKMRQVVDRARKELLQ